MFLISGSPGEGGGSLTLWLCQKLLEEHKPWLSIILLDTSLEFVGHVRSGRVKAGLLTYASWNPPLWEQAKKIHSRFYIVEKNDGERELPQFFNAVQELEAYMKLRYKDDHSRAGREEKVLIFLNATCVEHGAYIKTEYEKYCQTAKAPGVATKDLIADMIPETGADLKIVNADIAEAKADIIVNAANGCGWMGGKRCAKKLHRGVAESLNFHTHGAIEKKALQAARKWNHIPSFLAGKKTGDIFFTEPCGLKCQWVIHAVTMRQPGSRSDIIRIGILVDVILERCQRLGWKNIAMPLLGCGTGGLKKDEVLDNIKRQAARYPDLEITIYDKETKI